MNARGTKLSTSLSDLLVNYAKACKPLTDEEIEQKTQEVFGDGSEFEKMLKEKISSAVSQTLAMIASESTFPQ